MSSVSPGDPTGPRGDAAGDGAGDVDSDTDDDDMPDPDDDALVAELLGRPPAGAFEVVVRAANGMPAVIANAPFLRDGTPMPTRYWLVDPVLREAVSHIESAGGVGQAEAAIPGEVLAAAHARYAEERDALIPEDHHGPRPSGGVGGTRQGVKCLHAHLAWWMTGADDPVGEWTALRIGLHSSGGRGSKFG
jgi:hypothetical protein